MTRAIRSILEDVAVYRHVTIEAITSQRRTRTLTGPRQEAMYLARCLTPASLTAIGRDIGMRDHTTVLHAVRTIEARRDADAVYRADLQSLTDRAGYRLAEDPASLVATADIDVGEAYQRIVQAHYRGERATAYADEIVAIAKRLVTVECRMAALGDVVAQIDAIGVDVAGLRDLVEHANGRSETAVGTLADLGAELAGLRRCLDAAAGPGGGTAVAPPQARPRLTAAASATVVAYERWQHDRFDASEKYALEGLERSLKTLRNTLTGKTEMAA